MRVVLFLVLIIYQVIYTLQDQLVQSDSCSQLHPQCLFIAAVGLSGSTTLMDIVNQHPKIHIRGENVDLYSGVIMRSMQKIYWQLDYDQALRQKDWEKIKYYSNIQKQRAYYGVGSNSFTPTMKTEIKSSALKKSELEMNNKWNFQEDYVKIQKSYFNIIKISKKFQKENGSDYNQMLKLKF